MPYTHNTHMSTKADLGNPPVQVPKLPRLPRRGNRTIYVADDSLWEKAKTLAGREGLSSVIAKALADFVAQRTADQAACQKLHFEIFGDDEDSPIEVIGFEGRQLLSGTYDLAVSPFEADGRLEAVIEIYRTKLGTFVLLATPATDERESRSRSAFDLYERHNSVRDLMSGHIVGCFAAVNRHELLTELTKGLGKDAVTWID